MEGPALNDHSDSDSGESWTLLDHDPVLGEDSHSESKNINKSFIAENSEKDEDTDGISIISDSETESPSTFLVHSSSDDQSVKEEIPVYDPKNIEFTTNINSKEAKDTEPLVEDNTTGDNMKHKIYVHRRNNRLSTVLNIIMLVSVMTAAGVAIGHMWGAKNDCPSKTPTSFNKILSDLYKLQAENAVYRNKLRELSLIIEDNLHNECVRERESEVPQNKEETVKCRQQKIYEIQKYLRNNVGEGRRNKRTAIPYEQKQNENKLKSINAQNISKVKAIKEQKLDEKSNSKVYTVNSKSQQHEDYEELFTPELKEVKHWPERKISYADSLKTYNFVREGTNDNVYKNTEKKLKHRKKIKITYNMPESSISEEYIVKDGRYSTPKHKLELKKHDRQKMRSNTKRRNKHEHWELKEGLLKYYDGLSAKIFHSNNFVKNPINPGDKKDIKVHIKIKTDQGFVNPYDDYMNKGEMEDNTKPDKNLNWFEKRAQFRKEARKRQELELLNLSNSNTGEWYFKHMHKRQQCREENCTSKRIPNKKINFKTKP